MARRDMVLPPRRLVIAAVIFGLFAVCDIVLFGWLILKSLSQREIEKVLLETREEAEPLAQELAAQAESLGHEDLWVVVSVAEETKDNIRTVLSQRQLVGKVEIHDRDGRVVYEDETREVLPGDDAGPRVEVGEMDESPEMPLMLPRLGLEEVEVPIGDLGTLVIGLSEQEVGRRVRVLRRELTQQVSLIGLLTVTLLAVAFAVIWILFRRAGRLEDQAREAERMAYIGTLASGLAHELRNPLNSLSLNMQLLEEEASEPGSGGSQGRLLAITRSEITRLERLVTDFLTYARPRPLEREEVPVAALLVRVTEVLAGEVRQRGAEVRIEDMSGGARVRVDRGQLNQLLINLVQNALAATADAVGRPLVRLVVRRHPAHAVIEVVDNGCGIPEEVQPKIFDLFFSTRKGGTGLGLAIVERIARSHQAAIEVESRCGVGTTVRVRIPLSEARESIAVRSAAEVAFEG
ncbi:MAG: GHKL domain-containing protein [bacterium]|nr:GHKL domain-containing protein [bacterium]